MRRPGSRLRPGRTLGSLGAATVTLLALGAAPAYAAGAYTSQASAQALNVSLSGTSTIATTPYTVTNDNGTVTTTGAETPAVSVLGTQTSVVAGVLGQQAVANSDGTSAACAGLLSAGGTIQVGTSGTCAVTAGTSASPGVSIPAIRLTASAIYETCTANAAGQVTSGVQLVDAAIGTTSLASLNGAAPNSTLNVGLATVTANYQPSPQTAGAVTATALHITVLGTVVVVNIGTVSCGPNAAISGVAVVPLKGLPFAAGGAGLAALIVVPWYLRRRRAGQAAA
ncbi:MAG: hypothetical protein ACYC1D_08055 [Acidimicrobiales bacterium]